MQGSSRRAPEIGVDLDLGRWSASSALAPGEDFRQLGRRAGRDVTALRQNGDPRLSEADREILRRVTRGDLQVEFQAALDADLVADPLLGGHHDDDDRDQS
jgi:hypothetical protein